MKIPTLTRLMAALALVSAAPLTAQAAFNQILYTANYTGTPVLGTDTLGGVTYATVGYGDLYNDGQPGMPCLPVDYLRFSVPYNATNFTVTATCPVMYKTTLNLSHLVYPSQPPRLMNDTTPVVITLPDSVAYSTGGSYPVQSAWVVDEGFLDGENHIVTVAVLPFVYKHTSTSDKLEQWKRVNVRLQYDLNDSLAMCPIFRYNLDLRNKGYEKVQEIVANPNDVIKFAPKELYDSTSDFSFNETNLDTIDSTKYPYLIITTPQLKHSVRRIAALKRQKGNNVKVVTINEVINDPFAQCGDVVDPFGIGYDVYPVFTDSAGILRQYLRNAYIYNSTRYVLLVGSEIPYRTISVPHPYNSNDTIYDIPSDLYYCDLNGDWSDRLSFIDFDHFTELNVGRILADNEDQVDNYTDKLLRYEINPGHGDYDYLNRILFTACHDVYEMSWRYPNIKQLFLTTFRDSSEIIESERLDYPSGSEIVNRINNQHFSFLSFNNYAYPTGIITCGYSTNEIGLPLIDTSDKIRNYLWAIDSVKIIENNRVYELDDHICNGLNNIENKWYPCICFSMGDGTVSFNKVPRFEQINEVLGKSFTLGKDYGGPAFIGNTRADINWESLKMQSTLSIAFANAYHIIGDAFNQSRYSSFFYDYSCLIYNLLGDPEFTIWPYEYQMIHSNPVFSVTRTDSTVIINKYNSTVTYCNNEDQSYGRYSDRHISPNSLLMASRFNEIPFILPLYLQNIRFSRSQYILASDVKAGNSIDENRTNGDVIITEGIEYEIEASGKVTLEDGFKVERGALFAVYPSCY